MQTRKHSLIESITNTLIGFIIALITQLIIYPILDIEVRFHQNVIITCVFTFVSVSRGYLVRRFFNKQRQVNYTDSNRIAKGKELIFIDNKQNLHS